MSTRRITRSMSKQAATITDHFGERKAKGTDLSGKSLGDEDSSTTRSAKSSLISSRVQIALSEVEYETIPVETVQKERQSKTALFGIFTEKESKVKKVIKEETNLEEDSIARSPLGYSSSLMTEEVKRSKETKLPSSYKELFELFKACEQMVSLVKTQVLTFSLLSKRLKKMRKDLTLDRFLQLLAVYPQAYRVRVEKITVGDGMGGNRSSRWEHVIMPNLVDDLTSFVNGPVKVPQRGAMDATNRLQGWRLTCRQQVFHCLLSRRVIAAHETFMDEHNLNSSVLPPSSPFIRPRFHKEFSLKIDSLCPSIEKAQIEQFPVEVGGNSQQGMRQFIKLASDTITSISSGVEEDIAMVRSPEKKLVSSRGDPLSPVKYTETSKPMSVLERIKAKKAEKAAKAMVRNPELEKKIANLKILVNGKILTLIFDIYQWHTQTSMNTTLLTERLVKSGRIVEDCIPSILDRLTTVASDCFSLEKTSMGKFLKVIPDNSPATCTKVEDTLKKAMEECVRQSVVQSQRAR